MRKDYSWINDRQREIDENRFQSAIVNHNVNAKWLISALTKRDLPIVVTNLGAGVKRIMLAENVCPQCSGKGYIK